MTLVIKMNHRNFSGEGKKILCRIELKEQCQDVMWDKAMSPASDAMHQ